MVIFIQINDSTQYAGLDEEYLGFVQVQNFKKFLKDVNKYVRGGGRGGEVTLKT